MRQQVSPLFICVKQIFYQHIYNALFLLLFSPGHEIVGKIHVKHIYEIAKVKKIDQENIPLEQIARCIAGTCVSMGIQVVADETEVA
jgi:hypothetical protein